MQRKLPRFIPPESTVRRTASPDDRPPSVRFESQHSYASVLARLERATEAVSRRVRVDPSSRIARWQAEIARIESADKRAILQEIASHIDPETWDHPYRSSFLALGEARVFIEVVEQLIEHLGDRDLRELASGHPDPSLDSHSARGRDKEFEWFIAAICRRAGLPVALAEPDILIKFSGEIRSIAAKRPTSRQRLESNVKKASAQILEAGYPGYIFLEVTRYLDTEVRYVEHERDRGAHVLQHLSAIGRRLQEGGRRNDLVQGLFIRAAFPLVSPGFMYGTAEHLQGIAVRGANKGEHIRLMNQLLSGARGV